jgi:uncharacterized protein
MNSNKPNIDAELVEKSKTIATELMAEIDGVTGVVIATADGFDVASVSRNALDSARVAALASSISAIGQVVSEEAGLGRSKSIIVDTETGFVAVYSVKRSDVSLVLNVISNANALLGQVHYSAAQAVKKLCSS